MKHELAYGVEFLSKIPGAPLLAAPPGPLTRVKESDLATLRRSVRSVTDKVIHDALLSSNVTGVASGLASTMLSVGAVLGQLSLEPDVEDFVYAAKELLEDARIPFDKGLKGSEWGDVRIGSVMLEIVCRGISSVLNLPYEAVLAEMHRAQMEQLRLIADGTVTPDSAVFAPDVEGIVRRHQRIEVQPVESEGGEI